MTAIRLLSANPLVLAYDKLAAIFELIHKYLPEMELIYMAGRISDLKTFVENLTEDCYFNTHHTFKS